MDNFILINCLLNAPLLLLSIIGNSLVLAAISRTPSLRSPSTVFLCGLAVSDLLVGLLVQPVYIAYQITPGLYRAASTLFGIACGVSLCTMTAISLDRFLALHYHMRYSNMMTDKRALYSLAGIWFICIAVSGLSLWMKSPAALAVGVAICFFISSFSYIKMYQIVRRHQLQILAQQQTVQNAEQNLDIVRSKKSAINSFIYYICMIMCYSPMFIFMIAHAISPTLRSKKFSLASTIVFMNSSVNPILYCWRLRELRTAVLKTLRKTLRQQSEGN